MEKRKCNGLLMTCSLRAFFTATALTWLLMAMALPSPTTLSSTDKPTSSNNGYSVHSSETDPSITNELDIPIIVDAGWRNFQWFGAGPVFNTEGPFTFSSTAQTILKVTDAFCKGDQFAIFDFGVQIGTTSAVPIGPCSGPTDTGDPDAAFSDPTYSHGTFPLGPGSHSLTIKVITNPFGAGGAYLRVDSLPFDICLQDDSNGNIIQFSSATGAYLFTNCAGLTLGGTGTVMIKGGVVTLTDTRPDRRVLAKIDRSTNKGTASIQLVTSGKTFTITDRNTADNSCVCSGRGRAIN